MLWFLVMFAVYLYVSYSLGTRGLQLIVEALSVSITWRFVIYLYHKIRGKNRRRRYTYSRMMENKRKKGLI